MIRRVRWCYNRLMHARIPLSASDEDLLRISAQNPGWRVERTADGQLLMTPPAGANSSRRNARLAAIVDEWAQSHGYVAFDSSGGFRLGASEVVSPDASLVAAESWAKLGDEERERFYPGAPAIAIELCSPTDEPERMRAKLQRLREAGTAYVIFIDPYRRAIWAEGTPPGGFDLNFEELLD